MTKPLTLYQRYKQGFPDKKIEYLDALCEAISANRDCAGDIVVRLREMIDVRTLLADILIEYSESEIDQIIEVLKSSKEMKK